MKKKGIFLILVLLTLINISLIISQPPFLQQSNINNGYEIKVPQQGLLKQNTDYKFHFHVFNLSNGVPITNSSTKCFFHLYDFYGNHIVKLNVSYDPDNVFNEWGAYIKGGNFSEIGEYSYIIQCNSILNKLGGYVSVGFNVNKSGLDLSISESIIYIILTISVFLFFMLSLYSMIIMPYSNIKNNKGEVTQIVKTKYVKLALILITYLLFIVFLNLIIGLSDNFINLTIYYGFLSFLFTTLNLLSLPLFVVIFVLYIFNILKDSAQTVNINKFGSVK